MKAITPKASAIRRPNQTLQEYLESLDTKEDENNAKLDKSRQKRMLERKNRRKFILYPENSFRAFWELMMTVCLLISCFQAPLEIAFTEGGSTVGTVIDILFAIDIFVNFFIAIYQEDDMILVDDHKSIAKNYLGGWFFIDIATVFPLDVLVEAGSVNNLVRLIRL